MFISNLFYSVVEPWTIVPRQRWQRVQIYGDLSHCTNQRESYYCYHINYGPDESGEMMIVPSDYTTIGWTGLGRAKLELI